MTDLLPLAMRAPEEVEALLDRAFGPGRHVRTAYAVRGASDAIDALSLAAVDRGALVGSVQCWPIALHGDDGREWPMVMLGPVAVVPERQGGGLGRRLVQASLDAAAHAGVDDAIALIGDPEYYGRFFGFAAERTGRWRLPGPFEPRRLLARGSGVPAAAGMLGMRAPARVSGFTPPVPAPT